MCQLHVQNLPSELVFDWAWVAFEESCCLSCGWKFSLLGIIDWGKWKVLLFLSSFTSPNISQLTIWEFLRILLHQSVYMVVRCIKFNEALARGISLHGFTVGVIKSFGHPSECLLMHQVLLHHGMPLLPYPFWCCVDPRVQKVCGVSRSSCFYHFFFSFYKHKLEK